MTIDEVIQEIISEPKYYIGVLPQSTAANFIRNYKAGKAKQKTILAFIGKFGYELESPAVYKKVNP